MMAGRFATPFLAKVPDSTRRLSLSTCKLVFRSILQWTGTPQCVATDLQLRERCLGLLGLYHEPYGKLSWWSATYSVQGTFVSTAHQLTSNIAV